MTAHGGPPDCKELRTFGLTLAAVCVLWAVILYFRGHPGGVRWFLGIAPVLVLLALAAPRGLRPLHFVWMPLARGIARVLTWLILALAFYLVFTPYSLVLKLIGKDPLERRFEPQQDSYWTRREPKPFDPQGMKRQF
jgi:hypothetical protein